MAMEQIGAHPLQKNNKLVLPEHLALRGAEEPAFALSAGLQAEVDFLEANRRAKLIKIPELRASSLITIAQGLKLAGRPTDEILAAAYGDIQSFRRRVFKKEPDLKESINNDPLRKLTHLLLALTNVSPTEQMIDEVRANIESYSYDIAPSITVNSQGAEGQLREKWINRRVALFEDTAEFAKFLITNDHNTSTEVVKELDIIVKDTHFANRAPVYIRTKAFRLLAETQFLARDFDGLNDTKVKIMQIDTRPDPVAEKAGRNDPNNEDRQHQIAVLSLNAAINSRVGESLTTIDNEGIEQILQSGNLDAIRALTTKRLITDLREVLGRQDINTQTRAVLIEGAQIAIDVERERLDAQNRALETLKDSLE